MKMIPIADIRPCPTNPRRRTGDIDELATSIRELGVLEPITVRPIAGAKVPFEIVCGHRRHAAAGIAELAELPAMVKDLDDAQAFEVQIAENLQRDDMHPLDEADAFHRATADHGWSVDELAARVGRSPDLVYRRLALCKLGKVARKLFDDGKLRTSVAELVARIPVAKLQSEAARELAGDKQNEPATIGRARDVIERRFMLRLEDAPFDTCDAKLVPSAGSCQDCARRTGAQPVLFSDASSPDLCTDPPCHARKTKAEAKRRLKLARTEGKEIMPAKVSTDIFYEGGHLQYGAEWVDLDDETYVKHGKRQKGMTWRELLGDKAQPVLAVDLEGRARELAPERAAKSAKRRYEREHAAPVSEADAAAKESAKAERRKREIAEKANDLAIAEAASAVAAFAGGVGEGVLGHRGFWTLAAVHLASSNFEAAGRVCERREIPMPTDVRHAVRDFAGKADAAAVAALTVELLLTVALDSWSDEEQKAAEALAGELGIDLKALRRSHAKALRAAGKKKAGAKRRPKKAAAARAEA